MNAKASKLSGLRPPIDLVSPSLTNQVSSLGLEQFRVLKSVFDKCHHIPTEKDTTEPILGSGLAERFNTTTNEQFQNEKISGMRQVKRDGDDVEAQSLMDEGKPSSPARSSPKMGGGGVRNPVFLAKVVARKVFDIIMTDDDEADLTTAAGAVTLLKDIVLGVILGVFTISLLIFLDHRNVVHFQSAHNFRNAAFQLLNDPETIANLEESSEMKFMTLQEYESKIKEIDGVQGKIESSKEVLEKRTKEAEEKQKEIDEIKDEHKKLMEDPLLGLINYNGGGRWNGKLTCDQRVQYLQDTYNTRPLIAKIDSMKHGKYYVGRILLTKLVSHLF